MKNYLTGILYLLYRHEKLVSFFYPIIMALRQENNYRLQDKQIVIQTLACEELLRFPASEFLVEAEKLLKAVNEKAGVFGVPKLEVFMNNIYSHSLNAKSSDKTGIIIILHDSRTKINSEKGFCIKSFVGANSTLFNAGLDTNFIYEVIHRRELLLIAIPLMLKHTAQMARLQSSKMSLIVRLSSRVCSLSVLTKIFAL